ncbi:MAG TPA: ribonuclease J [Vicinamibacterales bacterium]|nr:ribonuclease J [Vicinamibacterales bacterium]
MRERARVRLEGMTMSGHTADAAPRHPALEMVPLGGLGEFGLNCLAASYADTLVVIDAGSMFPEPELLGIDLIVPDFTYLARRDATHRALVLTHGHEDHIGAVPYLVRSFGGPIYGTPLTLALVGAKLAEHGIEPGDRLRPIHPRDRIAVGDLTLEFLRVTHSTPDCVSVALHSPVGTILHSGDFKVDQTPPDGRHFDFHRFAELGAEGVLAMFSDSTNIELPGVTGSELSVIPAFEEIFASTRGKLVVTAFATSVYRLQILVDLASRFGRKVAFIGRGMVETSQLAQRLGYLSVPPGLAVRDADVKALPPSQVLCLVTGSQGEPMSALSRIAIDDHRHVRLGPGDVVVFSAREIPGRERQIDRVVNHLARRGAEIVNQQTKHVHVSGHGSEEELKLLLSLVRPRCFLPIHGTFRQRARHARVGERLARSVPGSMDVLVAENGDVLHFDAGGCRVAGRVPSGRVLIDGAGVTGLGDEILRDRRHLAEDGLIVPVLAINKQTGAVEGVPEVITRGIVVPQGDEQPFRDLSRLIADIVDSASVEERTDYGIMRDKLGVELRRFFRKRVGQRPLVLPVIMEI